MKIEPYRQHALIRTKSGRNHCNKCKEHQPHLTSYCSVFGAPVEPADGGKK